MREDTFKYGMPLLCADWPSSTHFLIGGGGGQASTGLKNRIVVAKYEDGVMSDQLMEISFGTKCPLRSCLHPDLKNILIAFGDCGVKHLEVKLSDPRPTVAEIEGSPILDAFDGTQEEVCCLVFNSIGSLLLGGFAGGWIQVWAWPAMNPQIKLREEAMYRSLKDMDVSPDEAHLLVLTTARGTCEVWDYNEGKKLIDLEQPGHRGERFVHSRFLPNSPHPLFYTTVLTRSGGLVFKWKFLGNQMVKQLKKVRVVPEVITAFALTSKMVVVGSSEGNLVVLTTNRLLPMQVIKSAHMVFVTDLAFCKMQEPKDSLMVLSVSGDASAKITEIKARSEMALWVKSMLPYLIINIIFALLAWYLLHNYESLLETWEIQNFSTPDKEL